jgi:hypothetical protein
MLLFMTIRLGPGYRLLMIGAAIDAEQGIQ